jgi:hypothetical protein
LEAAITAAAVPAEHAPALGVAVVLRMLRQHLPPLPPEVHDEVLGAGSDAIGPVLRRRLPPAHAALVDALGTTFGNALQRCGILLARTPPPADHERAVRALVFGLGPALLRPPTDTASARRSPADRAAIDGATRRLLRHYAQRQRFRILAANGGGGALSAPLAGAPPLSPALTASARGRGGRALAMRSVAASVSALFEREFGTC